jgi:serine/threonine protein kinase
MRLMYHWLSRDMTMQQDPTSIGRYQVQRVLGHGAMGVVYLALDPLLKRPVAIKVVHALGDDAAHTLARFQREAEISAKLNHPNIVTVYDVGQDPEVGPFLAMEFIDGTSLSKLIRCGLSVETGMRLMIQGMGALQAAADAQIVHRDIKPANILVSIDGRFKLMDFGIARRDESHLTQAGMIFGTPSYTAPELLVGGEATIATDRYAFAVTAFEVVTGTLPFQAASVGTTLYRVVHDPPTIPETMKPYLAAVFHKALAKDPGDRYPDLPSFLTALVEALDFQEDVKLKLLAFIIGDHPFLNTQPMPSIDALEDIPQGTTPIYSTMASSVPEDTQTRLLHGTQPQVVELIEEMQKTPQESLVPKAKSEQPTVSAHPKAIFGVKRSMVWLAAALVILLGGGGAALLLSSNFKPVSLEIRTQPAGAKVSVEGRYVGQSPLSVMTPPRLSPLVQVELLGYLSQSQRVPKGERSVEFALVKNQFTLDVVSDPDGAEVLMDGQPMGKTPLKGMPLPSSGTPRLVLNKEGYEEWSTSLDKDMLFPEVINLTPKAKRKAH